MTYEQALKRGEKAGASKAGALEFQALMCRSLASLHAINPALVLKLSAKQVVKLAVNDPVALGDLMFV